MRRLRRLDLLAVDAESACSVDTSTRTITSVTADVRVLPWQECPGAIGGATRVEGMTDTLRAIADLDALLDLCAGR
jgi:hypothetical protein